MWRRFRFVAVLLLMGAVVNVLVAWGVELTRGHFDVVCTEHILPQAPGAPVTICRSPGFESVSPSSAGDPERLPPYSGMPWWSPPDELKDFHGGAWASGWPMLSLKGLSTRLPRGVRDCLRVRLDACPRWMWGRYNNGSVWIAYLPCRPIWPGFFVDTLFYAAIGWIVFVAATMRRRMRAWRGHCIRCGYPRGESSVCSECGASPKPLVAAAPAKAPGLS